MKTTPFHERSSAWNQTHLWHHWAGYLVADRYRHSVPFEYFGVRNSVAVYDTSPLFKYRITGTAATDFLAEVLVRDIRRCGVAEAQYTAWCDAAGYVMEDGVVLRTAAHEYWLACAEPNLFYFYRLIGERDVLIEDVSADYGILAVQGPHALDTLESLTPVAKDLVYFGVGPSKIDGVPVMLSRTGFTGALGYEMWAPADDAVLVWDAVMEAGAGYNITPMGMTALTMARLDAGMLLLDVDYSSARFAWTDAQRETPDELGLGWMIRLDDERDFVGRDAIAAERANRTSRWKTVGIRLDTASYEAAYNDVGLVAPKEGVYSESTHSLYDRDYDADRNAEYLGYVTSFMFSPILKRHIGLAKIPLGRSTPGSEAYLELMVSHRPTYIRAEVVKTPFWNPPNKTADYSEDVT